MQSVYSRPPPIQLGKSVGGKTEKYNSPQKLGSQLLYSFHSKWLIDFKSISNHLELFYALGLENGNHCIFMITFLWSCLSGFCAHCSMECSKVLYRSIFLVYRTPKDTTPQVRVGPVNNDSTLFRHPELETYHQMQFSLISNTLFFGGVCLQLSAGDKVSVF